MDTNTSTSKPGSPDTMSLPPAPPPSMLDIFMRIYRVPGWEPEPGHVEKLYDSYIDDVGNAMCTQRMSLWIDSLPHPRIVQDNKAAYQPQFLGLPPANAMHDGFQVHQHNTPGPTVTAAQTPVLNKQHMADTTPNMQHPNPLGQHPVGHEHEQPFTQAHIPQRRSSLFFEQSSRNNDQILSLARHTAAAAAHNEMMQRIQPLQLDDRSRPCASTQSQTDNTDNMDCCDDEVQPLCGPGMGRTREDKKRARSITRTATAASQPPAKRIKRTIASVRGRLSRIIPPAAAAAANREGRPGPLARLTAVTQRLSLDAPPQMIQVIGFAPGVAKERVKIAFVGNAGVGKTAFLRAFRTNKFDEQAVSATAIQYADGYEIDTIHVVLDGVPVACETWDVASQCDEDGHDADTVRPLLTTFFDAVAICHDVSDETTLQAAEHKWACKAERYCTGSPTILLGLKTDLRRPLPSLRLSHLKESTQTSFGQGADVAKKMGAQAYREASARTGDGVAAFFEAAIRAALQRRGRDSSRSRGRGREAAPGPVSRAKRAWEGLKKHLG